MLQLKSCYARQWIRITARVILRSLTYVNTILEVFGHSLHD